MSTAHRNAIEAEARRVFDAAFASEIRSSERTRALLLAVMFGVGGLFLGLVLRFLLPQSEQLDPHVWMIPLLSMTSLALYEGAAYASLSRKIRDGQPLSPGARYRNTVIEVTLVSCNLLGIGLALDPLLALVGPPPLLYFGFVILSPLVLDPRLSFLTGCLAAVQYALLAVLLRGPLLEVAPPSSVTVAHHFVIFALSMLICAAMAAAVTGQIRQRVLRSLEIAADRRRVLDRFGQQVSPDVVDKLLSQPDGLRSEERFVCVMFVDIRGFTSFAERRTPHELVDYLNTLWGEAVDIVNRHDGYINKFLGDGFMAVFGAPVAEGNVCQKAVEASLDLLDATARLGAAGHIEPTRLGIGLHAGLALTGNVGSPERLEYSVIGDVVNLASRIEGLTRHHDTSLLVSEVVYRAVELDDDAVSVQRLADVVVRGRAAPMSLYKLGAGAAAAGEAPAAEVAR